MRSTPPAQVIHPSCICQASPPRITILVNPARTRSLPSIQNAPLPSTRHAPSPPRITILTNPARKRQQLSTETSGNTQNASAATPTPKRSPTPISILKASVSAPSRRSVAAAAPAPSKRARPTPSSVPTISEPAAESSNGEVKPKAKPLPEIVAHEPGSWNVWTDAHQPGVGHGKMLDVPAVNGRGRLHEDDFARFYPREHTADQIMRRLRNMVRSGNRQAAANRRERARLRRQAAAGATTTTTPTPTVIPASTEDTPIITQTAGDTNAPECPSPTFETDNDSNPSTLVVPLLSV